MRSPLLGVLAFASAVPLAAQTAGISHQPVGCLVAGKYPRLQACLDEPDGVANARVFFRAEGTIAWYHVLMRREDACFAGLLPKPKRDLVGRHVEYYLEANHRRLGSPRTSEHRALVVRSGGECAGPLVAAISAAGPSAVFPALPAGFGAGGIGAGTVAAIVGAGLAAGGTAVGVGGGGTDPGPSAPAPSAPTTAPPVTAPPVTSTPNESMPPAPTQPLAVTCDARPDSGDAPLTVRFEATATGGSGPTTMRWDFGDGSGADTPVVDHVYRAAGRYQAVVVASRGGQSERCARTISAGVQPPLRHTLSVSKTGSGAGNVSSSPGGIDCGGACSAAFDEGTTVRFTATPATGSTFRGWGGLCSGAGVCSVTLPLAASTAGDVVVAEFQTVAAQLHTLSVTKAGSGNGTVRSSPGGIDCGSDCSETYATGTAVVLEAVPAGGSGFAGWSGACSGTGKCELTMNAAQTATATFLTLTSASHPLSVTLAGRGTGTVAGAGLSCPGDCSGSYAPGTTVSLQAQAGTQTVFSGWEQDCFLQSSLCQLTMNGPRSARARFDALFRLDVSVTGPGQVSGPSISCPPTCAVTRVDGAVVNLTAQPANSGAVFSGWAGDCSGPAPTCNVTMDQNRFVVATFTGPVADPETLAPREITWRSRLEIPSGTGAVQSGGRRVVVGAGLTRLLLPVGGGDVQVEAEIASSVPRGSIWRFEVEDPIEPGSLAGLAGEVVESSGETIAFRLRGPAGERVAFRFRVRRPR